MIGDSGNRTEFETGFVRDAGAGKGRMDLLPWFAIMEVSCLCEEGAMKYGERNIDKGAPLHSLLTSGLRHVARFIEGVDDGEDHLRAACWNFLWALNQRFTHPECNNLPWAEVQDSFQFLKDSVFVRDMAKCRVYIPTEGTAAPESFDCAGEETVEGVCDCGWCTDVRGCWGASEAAPVVEGEAEPTPPVEPIARY